MASRNGSNINAWNDFMKSLPYIMGDEVLCRLQVCFETQNISVIVLSADATPSQIAVCWLWARGNT